MNLARLFPIIRIYQAKMSSTDYPCYATCPKGLESLLLDELTTLGVASSKETVGGVHFSASLKVVYRCCLWSRLANKILLPLATIDCNDEKSLYQGVYDIPWEQHFNSDVSFKIDFSGTNDVIRNTQFGAVRVKDAIVDRFRRIFQIRPSVQKNNPDIVINARLSTSGRKRNQVHISLDLSGQSLHQRGYRTKQGEAPLKENLAAAILLRSNWPTISAKGGALIDPMCGSATLLTEATLIAADIAPGLYRKRWGFYHWTPFQSNDWELLVQEALDRKQAGLEKLKEGAYECRGYDKNPQVLKAAESNIALAGLSDFIRVHCKSIDEFKKQIPPDITSGLVICNPPYGERLSDEESLKPIYRQLGNVLRENFLGWQAAIFTANSRLSKTLGLRAKKIYKFLNGTIPTELVYFILDETAFVKEATLVADEKHFKSPEEKNITLSNGARMVCNRLQKNAKQLRKWKQKNQIEAYRLYDADMPEYAAAIDCYGEYVHIQEYAAPKTVDEQKAKTRFQEIVDAVKEALDVADENIFIKRRQRNKGKQQYERLQKESNRAKTSILEGKARFLVDLWSYLDTGLFLDHRPVRQLIAQMTTGKTLLNLFCYTATVTVQAALAGAKSSVSIDMSNTYIDWAKENFEANHINTKSHQLIQQDCLSWLQQCRQGFDVIFLDPPSFSNSKRMQDVFDVQRDHAALIHRCMELLNLGGTLIFSNNLRNFKLDVDISDSYHVEDITSQTLDLDFQRNKKIHQCFIINNK